MKKIFFLIVFFLCFSSVYALSPNISKKGTITYYEFIQDFKTKKFYDDKYVMKLVSD